MPNNQRWIVAFLILAATVAGGVWAASIRDQWASTLFAALASLQLILLAFRFNRGNLTDAAITLDRRRLAARTNATLMSAAYGWGGAAMLAVYMLSGLAWRHGWQYGTGMLLIAAALYLHGRNLGDAQSAMAAPKRLDISAMLALIQGIAAAISVVVLVASGKLATFKDDWAANHIFMAGGLAIVAISLIAYTADRRLKR